MIFNNISMKRVVAASALAVSALSLYSQSAEYFTPYKPTSLRMPSVPLVVNDPYFSIWSPADELNAVTTRHWTNAEKPLDGILRVDGVCYRFLGLEKKYILDQTLLPMADAGEWTGQVTYATQSGTDWTKLEFDDSSWQTQPGAFGSPKEYPYVATPWEGQNRDIYVRRYVDLTAEDLQKDLYVMYSHDDVFQLYINGVQVVSTGETWLQGETKKLGIYRRFLHEGENVIAVHCHNTTGGAYVDYGLFANSKTVNTSIKQAVQKSVDVLATNTYYTFECGPVMLDLVFTAPMLMDDLDLLSTPINYVSYQVRSSDGQEHDVQIYLATTPEIATNSSNQRTISRLETVDDVQYLRSGTTEQPVLGKASDGICIDWGYVYVPGINGTVSLASSLDVENVFATEGKLPVSKVQIVSSHVTNNPTLAFTNDLGKVTQASDFAMIGYDEVWDIIYMGQKYKGYWARDGKKITTAFKELRDNYDDIMQRCRAQDKIIYDDGMASGDAKYAELLSGCYRHMIAAHKLFRGPNDNLYFFSKENNSGGFVNTVDLTYPESPIFLLYNPELQKAMMRSIFEYCESDRWGFPFAAHDLGIYPHANGQAYSITRPDGNGGFAGNMPLEESGNMITLCATLAMLDGNTSFADQYWGTVKTWTDYLATYGQDPADQLCTDDFAGHSKRNTNLSIKAIMGVAGFAEMCRIKGDLETAAHYMEKAKNMAVKWEQMANGGDHYGRTYDYLDTWSQKYNIVWDKLWDINIFPSQVIEKELAYYLTKQNKYGLPLDNRANYTKSDWIMWTAALSPDKATFQKFLDPLYKYVDETNSRVPTSDWFDTHSGNMVGFKARSVVGGHWMRVLMDKFDKNVPFTSGILNHVSGGQKSVVSYYDLSGRRLAGPTRGINILKYSDGTTEKVVVK